MAADPLLGLVTRALGVAVDAIEVERVRTTPLAEVDRIRWRGPTGEGRLLFKRMHRNASVEAGLLPALARRGSPVEAVLASGIPPRHVPEPRPWILVREAEGVPLCAAGADDARRAAALLRSMHDGAREQLALFRALGVPELSPQTVVEEALAAAPLLEPRHAERLRALASGLRFEALASAAPTLAHGDLTCERVVARDERVVILDWMRAHVGSPLEDVGALVGSLRARDASLVPAALDGYPIDVDALAEAERLHLLAVVRWYAWEARERIRPLGECAAAIAAAIE